MISNKYTPAPWTDKTAAAAQAGDAVLLAGGRPFSVDVRVLSEPNYQLAMKAVNAHDALVAALEAMREFLDPMRFDRGSDNVRADELDKMAIGALSLARGGK